MPIMTAMDDNVGHGTLTLGGLMLDLERRELRDASGAPATLRPQALAVLLHLARHTGQAVDKDELLQAVWGAVVVTEDSLVKCIGEIRRALHDHAHRIVRTEPKRGYRLIADAPAPVAPAEADFRQEIRYCIAPDGVRIAYASSGAGRLLVRAAHWMLHLDWDWRSEAMGARIRELSQRFRLVRYDGRGCGLSDRDVLPATLDEHVGDLECVVDAAGLERFALLGISGGGATSIRYAARHPERVTHLVLAGATVLGALRRGVSPQHVDALARLMEDGWGLDNAAFRQLFTSQFWPGATPQQLDSYNQLQRLTCSPRAAAAMLRRNGNLDATADLPKVRCPTLVMHSPRDLMAPFEQGQLIAASIPGARLELLDTPNHTPLPGEPAFAQFMRAIDEFVDGAGNVRSLPRVDSRPALHRVDSLPRPARSK